jgi:hypothetical protein
MADPRATLITGETIARHSFTTTLANLYGQLILLQSSYNAAILIVIHLPSFSCYKTPQVLGTVLDDTPSPVPYELDAHA